MIKNYELEVRTIEFIGLKAIKEILHTGNLTDSQFDKLFELYQNEMPYGTQKARTGDPYEFIFNQLTKFKFTSIKGERVMPKKQTVCALKKSVMDPCYLTDGVIALNEKGRCATCGKTPAEIDAPKETEVVEKQEEIVLTPEQMTEMKKIHKAVYKFSKAMENSMGVNLVKGKRGWNTDPAWAFKERMEKCLINIANSKDIASECVDLANFCMFIWKRTV